MLPVPPSHLRKLIESRPRLQSLLQIFISRLGNFAPESLYPLRWLSHANRRAYLNLQSPVFDSKLIQYEVAFLQSPVRRSRISEELRWARHWSRTDYDKIKIRVVFVHHISYFCSKLVFLDTRFCTVFDGLERKIAYLSRLSHNLNFFLALYAPEFVENIR